MSEIQHHPRPPTALKYETVAAGIRALISTSLAPHDPLPSERELMASYDVSRTTVRSAIKKLVDEGRVYNIRGSGTFVGSIASFTRTLKLKSFTEDMTNRGFSASSKILAVAMIEADQEIAGHLAIPIGTKCTHMRRLRLADNHAMAIEDVYLPKTVVAIEDLQLNESLYVQLGASDHEVYRAEEDIRAINLTAKDSRLLEVPDGSAALQVQRVGSSRKGQLVEFARTIYRSDRYNFRFAVTRDGNER